MSLQHALVHIILYIRRKKEWAAPLIHTHKIQVGMATSGTRNCLKPSKFYHNLLIKVSNASRPDLLGSFIEPKAVCPNYADSIDPCTCLHVYMFGLIYVHNSLSM